MNNFHKIIAFKTKEAATNFALKKWGDISKYSVAKNGRFTVAISGGNTPLDLYRKLGMRKNLPWEKTHIFLVDERYVPFFHEASNLRMIRKNLIENINIPQINIHPINTAEDTPEASAIKYEAELKSFFGLQEHEFPVFDLILLGIGADGHTASLFPGADALAEQKRLAVAVDNDRNADKRVTLTLAVINNAKNIIFLVTGKHKAHVMKEIIEEYNSQLPAASVKPKNGELFLILGECYS